MVHACSKTSLSKPAHPQAAQPCTQTVGRLLHSQAAFCMPASSPNPGTQGHNNTVAAAPLKLDSRSIRRPTAAGAGSTTGGPPEDVCHTPVRAAAHEEAGCLGGGHGALQLALGKALRMEGRHRRKAAPRVAVVQLPQQRAHAPAQTGAQRLRRCSLLGRARLHPQILPGKHQRIRRVRETSRARMVCRPWGRGSNLSSAKPGWPGRTAQRTAGSAAPSQGTPRPLVPAGRATSCSFHAA